MNYYKLSISETYIMYSEKKYKFDELMKVLVSLMISKKDSSSEFLGSLKKASFKPTIKLSSLNEKQDVTVKLDHQYLPIKILFKQRILIFETEKYSLLYDFNNRMISVSSNSTEMVSHYRETNIMNMSTIVDIVRRYFSDLCVEVKEVISDRQFVEESDTPSISIEEYSTTDSTTVENEDFLKQMESYNEKIKN